MKLKGIMSFTVIAIVEMKSQKAMEKTLGPGAGIRVSDIGKQ